MKFIIITGNELRHRFFALTVSKKLNVVHVYFEKKANVHEKFECTPEQKQIIDRHFALREKSEQQYFGAYNDVSSLPHSFIDTGKSNDPDITEHIKGLNSDAVLLFGSSLIKEPLLSLFDNKTINLHLGLSPYYRGSGTNFWPLFYNEPECVGATIHLATTQVDAGAILLQVRPPYNENDTIHDLGNKTIQASAEVLPDAVMRFFSGQLQPHTQPEGMGKVCKRKDLTAESIVKVYDNFENGMMAEFLNNIEKRLAAFPIIT